MPRTSLVDSLGELLDMQFSVVSRGQLLVLGMQDNAMQYRVRAGGPWQALLPGVYLAVTGVPNLPQKEMAGAALRRARQPHHRAGGLGALWPQESGDAGNDRRARACRAAASERWLRPLHRSARIPEQFASSGPVRFALAARAVADTARLLTDLRDVRAVIAGAVQRDGCTIGEPAAELGRGPIRGSAMLRSVVAEVAGGIRSTAEGDLRDLIKQARLPMPLSNASLYQGGTFIAKPDAWWPEAGVAAEADSREWHLSPPSGTARGGAMT